MSSNDYFDDLKKVFELFSKHLKNLSKRITKEETALTTEYENLQIQSEFIEDKQIFREEYLINLALEMLTIQSSMIEKISKIQTNMPDYHEDLNELEHYAYLYYNGR